MTKSHLTKEQVNSLESCLAGANLAADIAHAHVYIYVRNKNPQFINVYGQALPLKAFTAPFINMIGRKLRLAEEPLVGRTLQSGIIVTGKREGALGRFAQIKIFPLLDFRRRCFAAVAFEKTTLDGNINDDIFIDYAMGLLVNFEPRFTNESLYRRLSPSDGVMIVDKDKVVRATSNTARHILTLLGVSNPLGLRTNSRQINWPLVGMVMKAGIAESKELHKQGFLISLRVLPLIPKPDGQGAIVIINDITELKQKEEALLVKGVVIKEIHHRVKNNLQMIASLLRMQVRRTEDVFSQGVLRDVIGRINSIALVHEALSQQDTDLVDAAELLKQIYTAVLNGMVMPDFELETSFKADKLSITSQQASALGLILNELLQNALEHGFKDCKRGKLQVSFTVQKDYYSLVVADDGVGLPEGFVPSESNNLGLKIIKTMTDSDLHGEFTMQVLEKGVKSTIYVPRKSDH
ncbi:MAG TPA: histidine kinase N-terminal domain-containing protein [Candidatus Avacidaminococcus intestinavium]|uniref:histidine kinase n=1 Tax=Candidatus Avacidaminococcus intestinavium TaxID=2840684 RepID=A0A9D1MPY3_9FIRM|nr:histidine kinase N-terminal domain-containing protein [Candidatus Avacidaminococcus intestinavium]